LWRKRAGLIDMLGCFSIPPAQWGTPQKNFGAEDANIRTMIQNILYF